MTGDSPDILDAQQDDQVPLSNLMGMPVLAVNGEAIGEVEHLLLTDEGRPEAIVISLGGILGVGGKDIAVPWAKTEVRLRQ
jgi:sporulation protein YlmC with PRC-barrel domain